MEYLNCVRVARSQLVSLLQANFDPNFSEEKLHYDLISELHFDEEDISFVLIPDIHEYLGSEIPDTVWKKCHTGNDIAKAMADVLVITLNKKSFNQ